MLEEEALHKKRGHIDQYSQHMLFVFIYDHIRKTKKSSAWHCFVQAVGATTCSSFSISVSINNSFRFGGFMFFKVIVSDVVGLFK